MNLSDLTLFLPHPFRTLSDLDICFSSRIVSERWSSFIGFSATYRYAFLQKAQGKVPGDDVWFWWSFQGVWFLQVAQACQPIPLELMWVSTWVRKGMWITILVNLCISFQSEWRPSDQDWVWHLNQSLTTSLTTTPGRGLCVVWRSEMVRLAHTICFCLTGMTLYWRLWKAHGQKFLKGGMSAHWVWSWGRLTSQPATWVTSSLFVWRMGPPQRWEPIGCIVWFWRLWPRLGSICLTLSSRWNVWLLVTSENFP